MKIKEGFILKEIAGQSVVIAVGESSQVFNGIVKLNETGKKIWDELILGAELEDVVNALLEEYDVDESRAREDAVKFIDKLRGEGILED